MMMLIDAIRLAFRSLFRNKLRAILTILGILIGIAAVVTVTALGEGAKDRVTAQMQSLGANMLIVWPATAAPGPRNTSTALTLTEHDASAILRECPSVIAVAAANNARAQLTYQDMHHSTSVVGTTTEYFRVRDWNVQKGTLWSETDEKLGTRSCLIGTTVKTRLFGESDPLGKHVRLGAKGACQVIGLLESKGQSSFGSDQDDVLLMPLRTFSARVRFKPKQSVDAIYVSASNALTTKRAEAQIQSLLMQRHRIANGKEPDFRVRNLQEVQKSFESMQDTLSALLLFIAAISLVVGGIGVMNIMLVSVAERTREIGIRMAIGARSKDILLQFLAESVALAVLGGCFGALSGYALVRTIANMLKWPLQMSVQALGIALSVSATIGVVFGFFPARRASQLDPIEALRRE